jgi:hypothetical protein
VASARLHQAEAQATSRCPRVTQAPAQHLQATHLLRLGTRLPRQASAVRASVPHHQATRLPALSTRLRRQATHQRRLLMAHPRLQATHQLRPATHQRRRRTRQHPQATALLRRRTVARLHHITARHPQRTAQRRLRTAPRARSLVQTTTGAHLLRQLRRHTAPLLHNTLLRAPLAMQRTRLHRPSSPPRHRVRHHTRRLRQSGRLLARHTRLRKFTDHSCRSPHWPLFADLYQISEAVIDTMAIKYKSEHVHVS